MDINEKIKQYSIELSAAANKLDHNENELVIAFLKDNLENYKRIYNKDVRSSMTHDKILGDILSKFPGCNRKRVKRCLNRHLVFDSTYCESVIPCTFFLILFFIPVIITIIITKGTNVIGWSVLISFVIAFIISQIIELILNNVKLYSN